MKKRSSIQKVVLLFDAMLLWGSQGATAQLKVRTVADLPATTPIIHLSQSDQSIAREKLKSLEAARKAWEDEVARIERKYVAVPESSSRCYAHRFTIGQSDSQVCVPIEWQSGFEFGDDFSVILPRRPMEPPPGGMKLLQVPGVLTQ